MNKKTRCEWSQYAGSDTQIYLDYHNNEWGRPIHDDNKLFEMLILEGMQARLSWLTVLKKREAFRVDLTNSTLAKLLSMMTKSGQSLW